MNPIDNVRANTIAPVRDRTELKGNAKPESGKGVPFSDFLGESLGKTKDAGTPSTANELKFSAHAQTRMQSRGIELSPDEILKMREAVSRAGQKGSKESLILTDKAAFVVSVKNGTVITAVDKDSMKENIFTNIDSTIMI